jgi:flap endonuclease-1
MPIWYPTRFLTAVGPNSDGTLITQRFHFANNPHPHRHVIGWYKVIKELNDAGVRAICVFDGQRNAAKEAEVCLSKTA